MGYWGGTGRVEIGNVFVKKLGSGLVVQRFPFGWMVYLFALYHLGMVPGDGVLKCFPKVWIFMSLLGRWWGVESDKIGNVELKQLGSGLVVQRFPFGYQVQFFALYHVGMPLRYGFSRGL